MSIQRLNDNFSSVADLNFHLLFLTNAKDEYHTSLSYELSYKRKILWLKVHSVYEEGHLSEDSHNNIIGINAKGCQELS